MSKDIKNKFGWTILFFTSNLFAQGQPVPHEFSNGNAIVASEFNANFQELSNRNKNSKDQIDQNTAAIDTLETAVNGLQATTSQNSASIATTQTNVSNVQATAAQNASDIGSIQSSLSALQGSVSQNTADVVTLNTNIASIDGTVTQIQSDLANLQSAGGVQPLLQFVGNSIGTVNGGQGIRTMTELCQADYLESRICTTEEYAKTISFPTSIPAIENAWIMSSQLVGSGGGGGGDVPLSDAYSGISSNQAGASFFNCRGWNDALLSGNRGIIVSESGMFSSTTCDLVQPVACCK